MKTPAIVDLATQYNSALYIDPSVRNSVLNQDGDIADVGYQSDKLNTNVTNAVTYAYDNYTKIDDFGFDAERDGSGSVYCSAGVLDDIICVGGDRFLIEFDFELVSGNYPSFNFVSSYNSSAARSNVELAVAGRNRKILTASLSDTMAVSFNVLSVLTRFEIRNISVKKIGDTVAEIIDLSGNSTFTQATAENQGGLSEDGGILMAQGEEK